MIKHITIALMFLSLHTFSQNIGQETNTKINQVDIQGNKQGKWIGTYDNGKIKYEAYFVNNKPIGELKRYYDNEKLKLIMHIDEKGETSKATFYYEDGTTIMSEGYYFGDKKDSTWKYYDVVGVLNSEENFNKGKKHGMAKVFYPNGISVFQEMAWQNDKKHGPWKRYSENGKTELETMHLNGLRHGIFNTFYPSGKIKIQGEYFEDKPHGKWKFYKEDGSIKYEIDYNYGKPIMNEGYEKYLEEINKEVDDAINEKGKHVEPEQQMEKIMYQK